MYVCVCACVCTGIYRYQMFLYACVYVCMYVCIQGVPKQKITKFGVQAAKGYFIVFYCILLCVCVCVCVCVCCL